MPLDSWSDSPDIFTLSATAKFLESNATKEVTAVDAGFPSSLNLFGEFIEVSPSATFVCSSTPSGPSTNYRFRGYYILGSTYEFWTGSSINTPNPSGNPLINIVIDCILDA
jgi:hypothetical protein